ncbi:MAG TPA: OmpA family protein [Bacteroidales bacterium]|jgi:outer membrane protein OmpA-like peptidoglycan-associated protein/YHS domain-containing protein|nr:OmpA family protein [Bacteroidales bacterium]
MADIPSDSQVYAYTLMTRRVFFFVFFWIAAFGLNAQVVHTSSNKAMKMYNQGNAEYEFMNFSAAEKSFREAIAADKRFYEAYLILGDLLSKQKRYTEAADAYRSAVRIDSLFYKPVFYSLASAEFYSGDYSRALVHYRIYLAQPGMLEKNRKSASDNVRNAEFAVVALKKPVPFNPVNAGSGINTEDDEYWPSITADGGTLMFTRQNTKTGKPGPSQEDFYISTFFDNQWQTAVNAGYPLNTRLNEGAQSLSSDGQYMYFTACDRQGGMGSCDIYYSAFSDGKWSQPANIGIPVNSSAWESQPSVSADGKTLFFCSNRQGGCGGKDIWYSRLLDDGKWSKPVNPGFTINTSGDEMSPFIHFDGKTLYFSSDGRTGMGGFDIFKTTLREDSTWEEPHNLGYPINTYNDETGLIIGSDGSKAYFSSLRDTKAGKDIFYFDVYESARPNPVSYLKGKVYDRETGKLLKADYELINLSDGRTALKNSTDATGSFLVCLPSGYNYGINVSRPGYLFYSESFMLEGQHTIAEPFVKKITLSPIREGEKMQLSNVFYEVDSWELRKESILELNNLAKLLTLNKNLVVEIGGFTDSTGSDEYNFGLSEKRALSVVDYLVSKGIEPARLRYKGYGNSAPIGDNVTSEGRKLNRRTEVKILSNTKPDPVVPGSSKSTKPVK